MKKQFILILLLNFAFSQTDLLWTEVSGDTVTIHHDNTERNCGSLFEFSITFLDSNIIEITEVDTGNIAFCGCEFDLELMMGGLSTGTWTGEIYGQDLDNNGETEYYGSVDFIIEDSLGTEFLANGYQSPCNATSDALAFFPLHIGDMWQYQQSNQDTTFYFTNQIIGDTTMPNGETYFVKTKDGSSYFQYLRIDTSISVVAEYDSGSCTNNEFSLYPLLTYNDSITPWTNCLDYYYNVSFLDPDRLFIEYDWMLYQEYTFTKGIGLTSLFVVEGTSGTTNLNAAIINGVTYGEFVGVEDGHPIPENFKLYQPYPNPFNPTTTIRFNVGDAYMLPLRLDIFNITGRLVETLVSGELVAGEHEIVWNAGNLSSGVYFVQLVSGDFSQTQKVILMK
ncbi:MAG: T9SS type A sorting domain-containing protein [Fidelibacterota bacterium]